MSDTSAGARAILFTLLAGPLLAGALPAQAASFDCQKPDLAADEAAICQTLSLNDLDVKMVTTFDLLSGLLAMGARGELQDQQIAWLTERGECKGDVACLTAAYTARLAQLATVYEGVQRPK
jgi:uncharacterized protein